MQRGMQKMPVESSLDGTRPWRCVCAAAGAVELAAPACRGRLATSTAGLLLVVLAGLALAGRIGTHGKGTLAPAPPGLAKKPASHLPPHLPWRRLPPRWQGSSRRHVHGPLVFAAVHRLRAPGPMF